MHFVLWLASYGKVRKDELMGFLELTTPHKETLELSLQNAISSGRVEVGAYQKLSLARNEEFSFRKAIRQLVTFGIPPYQMVAFLNNQGIYDTMDIIEEIEQGIVEGIYHSNGAGLVHIVLQPKSAAGDSPWYIEMRETMLDIDRSRTQGVS